MIARFPLSQPDVSAALARAVDSMPRLLLIVQLPGPADLDVSRRTPFKEILASVGEHLDLALVLDDGKPEGMWRDPLRDLCERLFSDRREAAQAASGMILTLRGRALAYFQRSLWEPMEDAEAVMDYVLRLHPKGRSRDDARSAAAQGRAHRKTRPAATREVPAEELEGPEVDPFLTLGIDPGATLEEAKRAYRVLVRRSHPDLAGKLTERQREQMERRTRDLNIAFEMIEKALGGRR